MKADGWDMVDDGNINKNAGQGKASCLEMALNSLTLTFLLPIEPELLSTPDEIEIVELVGAATSDGTPLTGQPPSFTGGPPMPNGQGGGPPPP
ncbi:MAG: hypothetical protein ACI9VR_003367 [Cognaticolwellia sp.]|jgi:hypothetical protein